MSLFELPVSRGARWARIFVVLVLDLALAGTGIAMIIAYVNARSDAADRSSPAIDAGLGPEVEVLSPEPVVDEPADGDTDPPVGPERVARNSSAAKRPKPRPAGDSTTPADTRPNPKDPPKVPPKDAPADKRAGDSPAGDPADDPPAEGGEGEGDGDAGADESDPEDIDRLAATIRRVVLRHRPQIKRCYAQAAKVTTPDDPLEGRIDIRFSVMPDGSASGIKIVRNSTGSDVLSRCLSGQISIWSFPSGHSAPATFIWPFSFTAPKNK